MRRIFLSLIHRTSRASRLQSCVDSFGKIGGLVVVFFILVCEDADATKYLGGSFNAVTEIWRDV